MQPRDLTPLILCGGKGTRLLPLTDSCPKPLVTVKGVPLLTHLIRFFSVYGIRRYLVATGYKSDMFDRFFEAHHPEAEAILIDSGDVDILARIHDAARYIHGPFLLAYGDTLADVDLVRLLEFHQSHAGAVSVTTCALRSEFGILEIASDGRVCRFAEKPVLDQWINIGFFVFSPRALDLTHGCTSFRDLLERLVGLNELYSFRHDGLHITVNDARQLHEAEQQIEAYQNKLASLSPGVQR